MKVYSIKEINQDIGAAINKIFDGNIIIKGELQPPKKYANGSQYCQLLEKSGKKQYQLSCVSMCNAISVPPPENHKLVSCFNSVG